MNLYSENRLTKIRKYKFVPIRVVSEIQNWINWIKKRLQSYYSNVNSGAPGWIKQIKRLHTQLTVRFMTHFCT